jgi:hypothetical protein
MDVLVCAGHKEEKPEDFSDLYSLAKIGSKALETVNGVSYLIGSIPDLLYIASGALILVVVSFYIQWILDFIDKCLPFFHNFCFIIWDGV